MFCKAGFIMLALPACLVLVLCCAVPRCCCSCCCWCFVHAHPVSAIFSVEALDHSFMKPGNVVGLAEGSWRKQLLDGYKAVLCDQSKKWGYCSGVISSTHWTYLLSVSCFCTQVYFWELSGLCCWYMSFSICKATTSLVMATWGFKMWFSKCEIEQSLR